MSRFTYVLLIIVVYLFLPMCVQAEVFSAKKSKPDEGVGRYSQFVLAAILKDIGLEFDDSKKIEPDRKKVEPDKRKRDSDNSKKKEKKKESGFWADDDDFLDDDSDFDSMSFEDVVDEFEKEYAATADAWNKEYEETVARWNKAKKKYNQEKEKYAQTTFNLSSFVYSDNKEQAVSAIAPKVGIDDYKPGEYHVIPYAVEIDIRNQNFRGTCAAFAGIRAIEVLLNQNRGRYSYLKNIDLSEQHFYWLSKPKCIETPCRAAGSNFNDGFSRSTLTDNPLTAIRLEMDCPYIPYSNKSNDTYTPLTACTIKKGFVNVTRFNHRLKPDQLINELASNRPVAAGLKLPKSFYNTNGLLRVNDLQSRDKGTDSHASGHAVLFVGFIKLPDNYWADEGKYCVMTANSWGAGWGAGGYACLTQKWIEKFAIKNFLTSVDEVRSFSSPK